MASPTLRKRPRRRSPTGPGVLVQPRDAGPAAPSADRSSGRRIASNFAFLSLAELVCRATSVLVSFSLMKRLGVVGYGRIEFAFNVVFWLVLLVRDSSDVIVARELSRHPRLIKPLVDHVLAIKGLFSLVLFTGLALVGCADLEGFRGLVGAGLLRSDALHHGQRARFRLSRNRVHGSAGGFALRANLHLRRRGAGLGRMTRDGSSGFRSGWLSAKPAGSAWSGCIT